MAAYESRARVLRSTTNRIVILDFGIDGMGLLYINK